MSVRSDLTPAQERQLMDCYRTLQRLAAGCEVPAVLAAVRVAAAELRAALDSQAVDFAFFADPVPADREQAGAA